MIVINIQNSPFVNENIIMDLVKDGQVTAKQIKGYLKVREQYKQYISTRIAFFDAPDIYESFKIDLFKIINKVRRQINPTLKIEGALLTLVDSRANLPKEIATQLKDNYGSILKLFNTQIPRAVKTAESTSSGGSVFSYDKSGRVANAYSSFAKEVLNDGKEHTKNATAKVR